MKPLNSSLSNAGISLGTFWRDQQNRDGNYYPFGLEIAGISSKALGFGGNENRIKFQKQELQSKEFSDGSGLETYQFKYRMDDPQIGRFWSVDPLADKYVYNSPYAFSENKVTTHVELEGLEAEYIFAHTKKEIANAFQGLANAIDRGINYFNKSSTATVVAETPVSTTSTGTTVTTTVSTNLGGNMQYIIANNTNAGNTEPLTKTTTNVTADTRTDIRTPIGTLSNKTSVDNKGVITNETGARTNIRVEGVPVTIGGTVAKSTDGQTKGTIQASTGTGNTQGLVNVQYTTNGNQQSAAVGVGGQVTAGKTTTTTIFGIKFNW